MFCIVYHYYIILLQNAIAVAVVVAVLPIQRVSDLPLHPLILPLCNWYCVPSIPSGIYMLSEAVWRYSMSWQGTGRDSSGNTPSAEAASNSSSSSISSVFRDIKYYCEVYCVYRLRLNIICIYLRIWNYSKQ